MYSTVTHGIQLDLYCRDEQLTHYNGGYENPRQKSLTNSIPCCHLVYKRKCEAIQQNKPKEFCWGPCDEEWHNTFPTYCIIPLRKLTCYHCHPSHGDPQSVHCIYNCVNESTHVYHSYTSIEVLCLVLKWKHVAIIIIANLTFSLWMGYWWH